MPWYQKTIVSGNVTEIYKYFSVRKRGKKYSPPSAKIGTTPEEKQALNNREARLEFSRLIATNFTHEHMWLRFSYRKSPDYETAKKEFKNFWRRLRYYIKKHNLPELKIAGIHGKGQGQIHHHVVMNFTDMNVLKELWGNGGVYFDELWSDDYERLAQYALDQAIREKNGKRWFRSRNLDDPDIDVKEVKRDGEYGPRVPKGNYLLESNCYVTSLGHKTWYIKTVKKDTEEIKIGGG